MVKNVEKLEEIYMGWKNLIFPTLEIEILAKQRIEICVDCKVPSGDGREIDGMNENKRCVKCRCYLPAKTRNPNSVCPLKKW